MRVFKNAYFVAVILIIMTSLLPGSTKIPGKLTIPIPEGYKQYNCKLTVSPSEILITCSERIFQPLNRFDIPKQAQWTIKMSDIYEVEILKKVDFLYIQTNNQFWNKYRNYFVEICEGFGIYEKDYWAIEFHIDNHKDTIALENELKKLLKDRYKINR